MDDELVFLLPGHFVLCGEFPCITLQSSFVHRSHSWSANICGCKRWLIYPPGQEKYLTDRLGNLADDVTSEEMTDQRKFPNFSKASKPITVIQREGEIIFVPRYCRKTVTVFHRALYFSLIDQVCKFSYICITLPSERSFFFISVAGTTKL